MSLLISPGCVVVVVQKIISGNSDALELTDCFVE